MNITAAQRISRFAIRCYARWLVRRDCTVTVSGLERLPRRGPVLLAARHVHHLYDATVLLTVLPRPLHFLVALDWARTPQQRWLLEQACRLAVWPGLLRADRLSSDSAAWQPCEVARYARRSLEEAAGLLAAGRVLVVFPEGSPAIDPEQPARALDSCLPFQPGFVSVARQAARALGRPVAVVPVGVGYRGAGRRWQVRVSLAPPVMVGAQADRAAVTRAVEGDVRRLSGLDD